MRKLKPRCVFGDLQTFCLFYVWGVSGAMTRCDPKSQLLDTFSYPPPRAELGIHMEAQVFFWNMGESIGISIISSSIVCQARLSFPGGCLFLISFRPFLLR